LTPSNRPRGGRIDIAWIRVRPGRSISPLHYHQREDEIFFLLSGTLTFIYGDEKKTLSAGDCVSCPPGTGIPHQLINESEEDCLYLLILPPDPDEVIVFPESGKVNVRSLNHIGSIDLDKKDSKLSMEETLNLVT